MAGLEGVLVDQDGEVRVARVCKELIRDVRNMITGFLKNNRMEPSTCRRNNIGGVPARRSWIPLKERKSILMMHKIAVGCINVTLPIRFGLTKFDHRKNQLSWFGKRTSSRTRVCTNGIVGSRKGGTCTSLARSS